MNLNHVTLIVTSFETSRAFYLSLGLELVVDSPPRYARFRLPKGDSTLSIEVTGEAAAPPRVQIYLEHDDLDREVAKLQSRGLVFTMPPTDMPYLWREAHLKDPDGHELRLYFAGTNRLDPPWRVGKQTSQS